MSDALPERPDLDQLRRRAKALRDAARSGDTDAVGRFTRHHRPPGQTEVTLSAAQLVVARELGFASWPRLKAAVVARESTRRRVSVFLAASVDGQAGRAADLLRSDPGLARRDVRASCALGDADAVRDALRADPAAALAVDDERGWPPLLYTCYSRWHQIEPERASGLAEVARVLLDAGASPSTNNGARPHHGYRSALHGTAMVNNPAVTRLLLERGASPNDGESLYQAAGHNDHSCLRLLLDHGAVIAGTWALEVAVGADDPTGAAMILDAAESPAQAAELATSVLPHAAADASSSMVEVLLAASARPDTRDDDQLSALRLAVRAGNLDAAATLRAHGAPDDTTSIDRFVGACMRADQAETRQLLAGHPGLLGELTKRDRAAIVDTAAKPDSAAAVRLMLELGFSPHARNGLGETALHTAAYAGNAETVRVLLDAGADVDARDANFDATPLAYATVGSGEQAGKPGDWATTVTLLIEAGASRHGVWVADKPPSEPLIPVLERYGVTPDPPAVEERPDDHGDAPATIGTGVMADIAEHLEAAYRHADLDVLGSLLHPRVRWTGDCANRDQVLDWYRGLIADDTTADVESIEVDRNAVVLCLSVSRHAVGARPSPPQLLYQVFTVEGAQIVDIRGYPDRRSALSRP